MLVQLLVVLMLMSNVLSLLSFSLLMPVMFTVVRVVVVGVDVDVDVVDICDTATSDAIIGCHHDVVIVVVDDIDGFTFVFVFCDCCVFGVVVVVVVDCSITGC